MFLQKSGANDAQLPKEHEDIGRMAEEIRNARKDDDDGDEGDAAVAGTKKPEKVREGTIISYLMQRSVP